MIRDERLLKEALKRLGDNCQLKRVALQKVGFTNGSRKTRLSVSAGILSIMSAVLTSAIMAKLLPENITQIASVFLAAFGGIAAILSATLYNENEMASIYAGSAKFLDIRERAGFILMCLNRDSLDASGGEDGYNRLLREYISLSELYDKYIPLMSDLKNQGFIGLSGPA